MTEPREPNKYDAPTESRGYITHDHGYVPSRPASRGAAPYSQPARDEYLHHPLHHIYRKRIRGIRMRWLGSGVVLGMILGVILTLIASALVVTTFPPVAQYFTGEPDLAVVIGEAYLNREATDRLKSGTVAGTGNLKLTDVKIDLKPDNRMDLQPTFNVDVAFLSFDLNPAVKNNLTVQDGKLVIAMVGDPQLGNLNLPLEMLPFDLNSEVRKSVDKVNNDLLISEINQALEAGFGGNQFTVDGVTTTDTNMTVRLVQR